MTLYRQLIILVTALVLLLFVGSFAISVDSTRDYLESQLGSHAQDAATSLGLSATTHLQEQDRAMVTAMVNAMFHRGDYLSIRIADLDGDTLIERAAELQIDGVPAWFVGAFALEPPERSATIMSGWRQIGDVTVVSHPGLAYRKLWQTTVQTVRVFALGAVLVLLVGLLGLRILLRPLRQVERQAQAICQREFPVVQERPHAPEFRRIVVAMNHLSTKVAGMLSDAEETAARLRRQAFQDAVTGLANRRQFMDVLEHRVAEPGTFAAGGMLLLQLNDLKAFNRAHGYTAGDRLLADTGRALASALDGQPPATLAHLSGGDFAILFESISESDLRGFAARAMLAVRALAGSPDWHATDVAHAGGVLYANQSATQLLSEADMALREAQRQGSNAWVVRRHREGSATARSGSEWRALIEGALKERRFRVLRQAVLACGDGELLHHEVFLRLRDPGNAGADIAAAVFMPMAESQGLSATVDRLVTETVVAGLEEDAYPGRVAVNLCASSLFDEAFMTWLEGLLRRHPPAARRLIFELPEYGVAADPNLLAGWIERLTPLGVEFSLDRFGKGFAGFGYLRSLKAHYLKVDGSFVRRLDQLEDNRFFLRALADIGHGLDMRVIADSVEDGRVWRTLRDLGIDGGRGFWLGHPE